MLVDISRKVGSLSKQLNRKKVRSGSYELTMQSSLTQVKKSSAVFSRRSYSQRIIVVLEHDLWTDSVVSKRPGYESGLLLDDRVLTVLECNVHRKIEVHRSGLRVSSLFYMR